MIDGVSWLAADLEQQLRHMGLSALCDLVEDLAEPRLLELAGEPLTRARTRRLYRIPDAGRPDLFVKVQIVHARDLSPRRWLSYATKGSPLVREAVASRALADLGLRTTEVLAFGARGRWPRCMRAMLVTRELSGHTDLASALAGGMAPEQAAAAIAAVESAVAGLHARGFALGGAAYRDILIPTGGRVGARDVVFIDVVGFGRGRRRRRRDLQTLASERRRFGPECFIQGSGAPATDGANEANESSP